MMIADIHRNGLTGQEINESVSIIFRLDRLRQLFPRFSTG